MVVIMKSEKEIRRMIEILEKTKIPSEDDRSKVKIQVDILKWVLGEPIENEP